MNTGNYWEKMKKQNLSLIERRKRKIKTKLRAGNKRQDSGVTERQRQLTAVIRK